MKRFARGTERDEGAVAIIAVAIVVVSIVLLAFVVDRGMVYFAKAQLQTTVDAAALAGARSLSCTDSTDADAKTAARDYAYYNDKVDVATSVIQTWSYNGKDYIYVPATRLVPQFFDGGASGAGVSVSAEGAASKVCVGGGYAIYAQSFITLNGGGSTRVNVNGAIFAGDPTNAGPNQGITFNGEASHFNFTEGVFAPASYTTGAYTSGGAELNKSIADPSTPTDVTSYATSLGLTQAIDALVIPPTQPVDRGECLINLSAPALESAAVIYCDGDAVISGSPSDHLKMVKSRAAMHITNDVGDPNHAVIYFAGGDFNVTGNNVFGTLYSPSGSITTNGQGVSVQYGRVIVSSFRVNGNGGSFSVDSSQDPFGSGDTMLSQ